MTDNRVNQLIKSVLKEAIEMPSLQEKSLISVRVWAEGATLKVLKRTRQADGDIIVVISHPVEGKENFFVKINPQGLISCEGKSISIKDDFEKLIQFLLEE